MTRHIDTKGNNNTKTHYNNVASACVWAVKNNN